MAQENFDAIVVGSGFGGAVTACRLGQAGLKVCLLERGRRYDLSSFPALPGEGQTLPDMRRWTWQGSQGLWDLRNLEGVTVAQSAGYGGGSLIYANVHLRPRDDVFDKEAWPADCVSRKGLDDYFDLVGSMLDIKPVPMRWRNVGKVGVMARAFRDAARGRARKGAPIDDIPRPDEDRNVFFPPLAIRFSDDPVDAEAEPPAPPFPRESALPTNAHGRHQGHCVRCGACDVGCRYGAKNTLDRNYLAVAEDTKNVSVQTLAEVLTVSTEHERPGEYQVVYMDHLIRSRETISAPYVFLCGGSINTTELLLRSMAQRRSKHKAGFDSALGNGLAKVDNVGKGYFVNADAVAMIFDANKKTYASAGPVITTALVHEFEKKVVKAGERPEIVKKPPRGRVSIAPRSWFLIEDGGYPQSLAHVFSIFENAGLLGRNRFDPDSLARALSRVTLLRDPSRPVERYPAFVDGLLAAVRDKSLPNLLPRDVLNARESLAKIVEQLRDAEVGDLVEEVRDSVIENSNLFRFLKALKVDKYWRWLWLTTHALSVRFMRIEREDLLRTTLGRTHHRYGVDEPRNISERLARVVLGEPYPVNPSTSSFKEVEIPVARDRQNAMLLAMGRDDRPAMLSLDNRHQLRADFPDRGFPTLGEEERVMRGIADQFDGTLRSNPMWALARRPITAHSHGGCALGQVTDPWGEVKGHPNLFINDGSLLPTPVGVNPSSTIAALAERNVEHFVLHKWYGLPEGSSRDALPAAWKEHIEQARLWSKRQDGVALEPPREPAAITLNHQSVGFSFKESMQGHLSSTHGDDRSKLPALGKRRIPLARFLVAEHDGREQKTAAHFRLTAAVRDIAAFLDDPNHRINLSGDLHLGGGFLSPPGQPVDIRIDNGSLDLLIESQAGGRLMVYHLPFKDGKGEPWTLVGYKEIQKDPGFDAWLDASTLYVELQKIEFAGPDLPDPTELAPKVRARGILRLGMQDFLQDQVQGLQALGTDDPARTMWTLGSFGLFFFGTMQGAYAPEIDRVLELFGMPSRPAEHGQVIKGAKTLDILTGL